MKTQNNINIHIEFRSCRLKKSIVKQNIKNKKT